MNAYRSFSLITGVLGTLLLLAGSTSLHGHGDLSRTEFRQPYYDEVFHYPIDRSELRLTGAFDEASLNQTAEMTDAEVEWLVDIYTGGSEYRIASSEDFTDAELEAWIALAEEADGFVAPVFRDTMGGSMSPYPMLMVSFPYPADEAARQAFLDAVTSLESIEYKYIYGDDNDELPPGYPGPDESDPYADDYSEEPLVPQEYAEISLSLNDGWSVLDLVESLQGRTEVIYVDVNMVVTGYPGIEEPEAVDALGGTPMAEGWVYQERLGYYFSESDAAVVGGDCVYLLGFGWFFIPDTSSSEYTWLYDYASTSWLWTSTGGESVAYPWFYREGGPWLFYAEGTSDPRWFYDDTAKAWVSE